MERTKACTKCGVIKPFSAFSKHRLAPDGYAYQCKECNAERAKKWRKTPAGIYTNIKGRQGFYRSHGSHRAKPFELSKEEFIEWYNSQDKICVYCDIHEEVMSLVDDCYNNWTNRLSVDAKDNEVGYVQGNLVLCCRRCNSIKSDLLTFTEMREFAQKYIKSRWIAQIKSTNSEEVEE